MGGSQGGRRRPRGIEYRPLESQQKFHDSAARFKGFSGPIGSGKSAALCHEAVKLSYLNPGRTGLIGAPTYPMLRDATQAALIEVLERNRIPHEFNRGENFLVMRETKIENAVSRGGRVREVEGKQSGVVRIGRIDVHVGAGVAAVGRAVERSAGETPVRVRGVDAEGVRLGLRTVRVEPGGRVRSTSRRSRSRTGFCWTGFRIITSG